MNCSEEGEPEVRRKRAGEVARELLARGVYQRAAARVVDNAEKEEPEAEEAWGRRQWAGEIGRESLARGGGVCPQATRAGEEDRKDKDNEEEKRTESLEEENLVAQQVVGTEPPREEPPERPNDDDIAS